ncbi:hypothetical protein OSB04_020410 [Centaurea solstitialis]|uniref:Uncharacterized protein n=1 Tax=Centaurea solstitialis TaxID=347529 RepID=A0AA38W3U9_9ASTR|nr:hypothetical protein OSB04_020410 [Centaurea solstitialis]
MISPPAAAISDMDENHHPPPPSATIDPPTPEDESTTTTTIITFQDGSSSITTSGSGATHIAITMNGNAPPFLIPNHKERGRFKQERYQFKKTGGRFSTTHFSSSHSNLIGAEVLVVAAAKVVVLEVVLVAEDDSQPHIFPLHTQTSLVLRCWWWRQRRWWCWRWCWWRRWLVVAEVAGGGGGGGRGGVGGGGAAVWVVADDGALACGGRRWQSTADEGGCRRWSREEEKISYNFPGLLYLIYAVALVVMYPSLAQLTQLKFQNYQQSPFETHSFFAYMTIVAYTIAILSSVILFYLFPQLENSAKECACRIYYIYVILKSVFYFSSIVAPLSLVLVLLIPHKFNWIGYIIIFALFLVVVVCNLSTCKKLLYNGSNLGDVQVY